MQNLKYDTNKHIHKTETDSQTQGTGCGSPRGEEWGDFHRQKDSPNAKS